MSKRLSKEGKTLLIIIVLIMGAILAFLLWPDATMGQF
jgi:hypothetical protein